MKKFFLIILIGFSLFFLKPIFAQAKLDVHFFYIKTCPHCAAEEKFLDDIEKKYPELKIHRYFIGEKENQELLKEFCKIYNAQKYEGLFPITFIGKEFFVGFDTPQGMGREIENSIKKQLKKLEISSPTPPQLEAPSLTSPNQAKEVSLPLVGKINLTEYTLPVQTVILGFLDGFNICSLGALVLILALVLVFRQRKKIFLFGGVFLLTTAVIYGFLIFLWYQIFSFLASFLRMMEILIGLLGIGGGIYFLKQFFKFRKEEAICQVKGGKKVASKFIPKIQKSIQESKNILLILLGVFAFSAVITIVEFPCSAVIPVIFAGILTKAHLSSLLYFLYLGIYLFFYLLDEIVVFLVAVFTMKIKLTSQKFILWITLIEAIILFLLGFYYLFGFLIIH